MNDDDAVAWLRRRASFGFHPDELDDDLARGPDGLLDQLVDPDGAGIPASPDPWDGLDLDIDPQGDPAERQELLAAWIDGVVSGRRGLVDWMTFFWHDHFAVQAQVVKRPVLMAGHFRLLAGHALGDFRQLLRDVTVDAAMLIYLDGARSTGRAPNENYGRELMELFSLGVGAFDEDDVRAGSAALTGWVVRPPDGEVTFVPRRHDSSPQRLLGRTVDDVDSVIDAVTAHEACGPFIAAKMAESLLGPGVEAGLTDRLGRSFAEGDYAIAPLVRGILEAGLDGAGSEVVGGPFGWFVRLVRASGARVPARLTVRGLHATGQLPMTPPNVAGWPSGRAWLSSSSLLARFRIAGALAEAAVDGPLSAAVDDDLDRAALLLGRAGGFSEATRRSIDDAPPSARLAAAMNAPDLLVI